MERPEHPRTGKHFIGVWVDDDLAERAKAKAQRQDRSVSSLVRKALREEVDR